MGFFGVEYLGDMSSCWRLRFQIVYFSRGGPVRGIFRSDDWMWCWMCIGRGGVLVAMSWLRWRPVRVIRIDVCCRWLGALISPPRPCIATYTPCVRRSMRIIRYGDSKLTRVLMGVLRRDSTRNILRCGDQSSGHMLILLRDNS